jgi:hypothetical protein
MKQSLNEKNFTTTPVLLSAYKFQALHCQGYLRFVRVDLRTATYDASTRGAHDWQKRKPGGISADVEHTWVLDCTAAGCP